MAKPDPINERLLPNTRAVNLALSKEASAGGLIQPGEWVDVMLTTDIEGPDGKASTRTAVIAPKVRVIAKRNVLWPVFTPLPDDKPVPFTLEVNPYRAALIEDVKKKGEISLVPIPASEQQRLETLRTEAERAGTPALLVAFANTETTEYQDEKDRVEQFNKGELSVGDRDLYRIFGLEEPKPKVEPTKTSIERIIGTDVRSVIAFNDDGQPISEKKLPGSAAAAAKPSTADSASFQFYKPGSRRGSDCPTCGKNGKK
jgi:hypothetical protein